MNKLKEIIGVLGITTDELSELTGISARTIQRHRNGYSMDCYCLSAYSEIFQFPMEYIAGAKNDIFGKFDEEDRMLSIEDMCKARFRAYNYEQIDNAKSYYLIGEKHNGEDINIVMHAITICSNGGEYEKKIPRLILNPNRKFFESGYGKLMIINTVEEAFALMCFGGVALIEKSLCEEYYPEYF